MKKNYTEIIVEILKDFQNDVLSSSVPDDDQETEVGEEWCWG